MVATIIYERETERERRAETEEERQRARREKGGKERGRNLRAMHDNIDP